MSEQHITSRQLQAERTKQNIFNAAIRLLETQSLESIRISDIVKEADVAAGTFYRYYNTKWDVYMETYSMIDDYFDQEVAPNITHPHVNERVLFFFDHYAQYQLSQDIELVRLIYNAKHSILNRADFSTEYNSGGLGTLKKTIQQGIDDGQLANFDSAVQIQRLFMLAVRGLVFNWCMQESRYDLRSETTSFVTRLLRIYAP